MYIAKYEEADKFNHDEYQERKLLLHKKEIKKLASSVSTEGYTLIPLNVYFKGSHAKVLVGLCKGKKNYNKKEAIKERDIKRSNNIYN